MKKSSKIIMIMVAVLLTFTLLSSCLVSSTMAKYVITKDATTVVSLKKFGVKLAIKTGTDFSNSGATINPTTPNDSTVSATVTVPLVPGYDYKDIIQFVPSKDTTADSVSVATNIKIKAEVTSISGTYDSKYYIPTDVYVNGSVTDVAFTSNTDVDTLKNSLLTAINTLLTSKVGAAVDGYYTTSLAAKGATSIDSGKTIKIGYKCPLTSTRANDTVMTAIGDSGPSVTIKYTVSLEQAS